MRKVCLLLLATTIASSTPSVPATAAPSLSGAQHERLANRVITCGVERDGLVETVRAVRARTETMAGAQR